MSLSWSWMPLPPAVLKAETALLRGKSRDFQLSLNPNRIFSRCIATPVSKLVSTFDPPICGNSHHLACEMQRTCPCCQSYPESPVSAEKLAFRIASHGSLQLAVPP